MKLLKRILLPLALVLGPSLWAVEPLPPISFSGGVDYTKICSQVADDHACDGSNMYGDRVGGANTRNGSHPLVATAVSSQPFSALFWTTISTTNVQINAVVGVSGDTIYYSTDATVTRWSILYRGLVTANQRFTFAVAQNAIYMTGNALTDPIFKWDVAASSFGLAILNPSTNTAVIYAKYLLWEKGYMLAANVRDVRDLPKNSTYYDDSIYYSYVLQPSSFSVDRILNVNPGDGEYLTGMTSKRTNVSLGTSIISTYKPSSVYSVSYTILNPAGQGGDQQITKVGEGFGHIADSPPENIGPYDVILSRDGIQEWNGGLVTRASLEGEKNNISNTYIKPILDKLIRRNTYKSAILKYYPKSNYIIFAYEDPDKFPQGKLNSSAFYDMLTGEWWPMKMMPIGSLETDKGPNGTGRLHVGDGMDGYVHVVDDPIDSDDSRKEISLDPMETTDGWLNAGISTNVVIVGTASLTLDLTGPVRTSSITKVFVMPMGEWYDKSQSSSTDKISFKIWPSSVGFLQTLRVDLQVKDVQGSFDNNFSSVTISSAALTAGSSAWTTIEIALSSFPIRDEWVNFQTESVPFARNLTRFGIRFVSTGTQGMTLFFDDLRLVAANKTPLNAFRATKQFNFGTMSDKDFQQIVLTRDKQRDSSLYIDVLTGQGSLASTVKLAPDVAKEIFVCGFAGKAGVTRLNSVDLTPGGSTTTASVNAFSYENGAADPNFLYTYDVSHDKLVKISRSNLAVNVSTYGGLSAATTGFNYVQEIAVETASDGNLILVDHMNHRIKEHRKKDLSLVRTYGQLGIGATSFYNPTGVDFDGNNIFVLDDTNQSIKKFTRSYALTTEAKLDINTIGNGSIKVGPQYLYVAYNRGSNDQIYFIDVVLEKRNKGDLSLVSRTLIRPDGIVASSTYSLRGSIALHSKFVYLTFNDNSLINGIFYLQKRLQSDLTLVKELATPFSMLGVIGDNLERESSQISEKIPLAAALPDPYVQFKFYTRDELENSFRLSEMSVQAEKHPYVPAP